MTPDEDVRRRAAALLLALAALLHVLANAPFPEPWGVVLVGAGVLAVVVTSGRSRAAVGVLAAGVVVTAWQESPDLPNHWLLASFAAVALVASWGGSLAPLRAVHLGFYAFAAFAKLNSSFFDPAVTCAGPFLRDVTSAVGLGGLDLAGRSWARGAAAVATATVESGVVVLLLRRATRTWGVVLAVGFHLVVAIPSGHQFYDFSSVLLVGWATFLPAEVLRRVGEAVLRRVRPGALRAAGVVVTAAGTAVAAAGAAGRLDRSSTIDVGWVLWQPLSVGALLVALWWWRTDRRGADVPVWPGLRPAVVLPVLVLLNGASPYLELKTGAAWNMYANLRTAGGETNHLLVPRTFPLTSPQDDLVEVLASGDPALQVYADLGYRLPVRTLRAHLQRRFDAPSTVRIDGEVVRLVPAEGIPARLGPPVPALVEQLFVLRATGADPDAPEPCQLGVLPAR